MILAVLNRIFVCVIALHGSSMHVVQTLHAVCLVLLSMAWAIFATSWGIWECDLNCRNMLIPGVGLCQLR